MPAAVIERLRQAAEEGRRNAPKGLEEHFARRAVRRAYIDMRVVRNDLERLGFKPAQD